MDKLKIYCDLKSQQFFNSNSMPLCNDFAGKKITAIILHYQRGTNYIMSGSSYLESSGMSIFTALMITS